MQADKLRLEQEALNLSKTLSAVMNDKFEIHCTEFDAETPIDKVLNMMHGLITKVRSGSERACVTLRLQLGYLQLVLPSVAPTARLQHVLQSYASPPPPPSPPPPHIDTDVPQHNLH